MLNVVHVYYDWFVSQHISCVGHTSTLTKGVTRSRDPQMWLCSIIYRFKLVSVEQVQ